MALNLVQHRAESSVWDRIDGSPVQAAAVEALKRRYPQQQSWFL